MNTWTIPENPAVETALRDAAKQGTLSHAILLTGPGDLTAAARFAAAAMECTAEAGRPCGHCTACHKVWEDIHPDVITVRDPERKNIAVDVVRQTVSDAYIRPNEGKRKIYIFEDCSILTETDQNVLLKTVEEGPSYVSFLFCAANPAHVLTTLRSRCVEWKLRPAVRQAAPISSSAEALCRALGAKKRGRVVEVTTSLEKKKIKREELQTLLSECRRCAVAALAQRCGAKSGETEPSFVNLADFIANNLTKVQITHTIEVLQRFQADCLYQVGASHVLGALAVELEGII